jgi:hypothetical protein
MITPDRPMGGHRRPTGGTVTATVTRALGGLLRADGVPDLWLPVLLRYSPVDPFAVRLVLLLDADSSVEWLLDRDDLARGLREPVGLGDVRVHVEGTDVVVTLQADGQPATRLLLPLADVVEALAGSYALVPTGTEAVPDAELDALLAGG